MGFQKKSGVATKFRSLLRAWASILGVASIVAFVRAREKQKRTEKRLRAALIEIAGVKKVRISKIIDIPPDS